MPRKYQETKTKEKFEKKVRTAGKKRIEESLSLSRHVKVEETSKISKPKRKLTPKEQKELNEGLLFAAVDAHIKRVKAYLKLGADVNAQEEYTGRTALNVAAEKGHTNICKLLIEHGADVNLQDSSLVLTALIWATWKKYTYTVRYLLSVGANPLLKNKVGQTAYDYADKGDMKQIIKAFENLWKGFGEKQTLLLIQNVNMAIRECSPEKMYEIVVNL